MLHEHPRIGSDGESEEVSLASDPDVTSPVKMRQKNRRLSEVSLYFLIYISCKGKDKDKKEKKLASN